MTTLNFLAILKPFKIHYYFHFLLFNFIPNDIFACFGLLGVHSAILASRGESEGSVDPSPRSLGFGVANESLVGRM